MTSQDLLDGIKLKTIITYLSDLSPKLAGTSKVATLLSFCNINNDYWQAAPEEEITWRDTTIASLCSTLKTAVETRQTGKQNEFDALGGGIE